MVNAKIAEGTMLESVDLTANIPVKSHMDYKLGWSLTSDKLTEKTREAFGRAVSERLSGLKFSVYGDNQQRVVFSIADSDHPGVCKHLVEMFQRANIEVSAMGGSGRFQTPPGWNESPSVELPRSFSGLEKFSEMIVDVLERVTGKENQTSGNVELAR